LREAGYPAEITQDGAIEVLGTAAIDQPDEIAALLVHAGCAPTMLNVEQEDLEHYFLKLVGGGGGSMKNTLSSAVGEAPKRCVQRCLCSPRWAFFLPAGRDSS
jgi:hypothetical protein